MFYIYRHIRPDTNEVFYIGKGLESSSRSHQRSGRNKYWHNVVNKNNGQYDVEIMMSGLSEQEALDKEAEFIKLYGRRCDGGTLCNLSLGGEGILGHKHSDETKEKMSKSAKGIIPSLETKIKISESKKGKSINKSIPILKDTQEKAWESNRKRIICTKTGNIYGSVKEAANHFNINYSTLKDYLRGFRTNKTTLTYLTDNQSLTN